MRRKAIYAGEGAQGVDFSGRWEKPVKYALIWVKSIRCCGSLRFWQNFQEEEGGKPAALPRNAQKETMPMSDTVTKIASIGELKSWLQYLQNRRTVEFSFQPTGSLAARYPRGSIGALLLKMMSLVRAIATTDVTRGGTLVEVRCKVTYHSCVRMLDAWRTQRFVGLTREEQMALPQAEEIVRKIAARGQQPMERLYMLYSCIGALIDYRAGDEHSAEFQQLSSVAWALLRKVANCQGFAGIMYLTGGMMGFRMGLQGGRSEAGPHMWNTIELGLHHYAMDCSAAAVARSQSRKMQVDYASFLMGRREATENGLTWDAEQESLRLSPGLDAANDYYRSRGTAYTSVEAAARDIWKRRLEGERATHIRIRGNRPITLDDLSHAISSAGKEPAMARAISRQLNGTTIAYSITGNGGHATLYASVEWQ